MQTIEEPERQVGEDTPLLGSSCRQGLQQTQHSRHRKQLRSPSPSCSNPCRSSEREIEDEDFQSQFASSSQKDKSPVRLPFEHAPSYSTIHNDAECCRNPLNALADPPAISFSWFLFPEGVSLRLENSGSVARDHLACERTFLAYMRTSLAIAASGVALVQLFSAASASSPQGSVHRLHHYVRPLGASTIFVGLLVLFIGVVRYFSVQTALTKGYFPAARLATGFIAVVLTALVTSTFAIMLAGKLELKTPVTPRP